ncbi:hypothetical protein CYMTET_49914 [Cymbomonas tetramitiformis]|uniref:F-box domain-containing protein n=1 Tax=Cymbomonas tetramitiformis TaxID=36881 RepID=A0AAE0EU87_9CHLO|nr:hypothetical protein CYMTET_49914 [Cymbomonas tetramitiformis]
MGTLEPDQSGKRSATLLEQVLIDVFKFLDVESCLRARAVCRSWKHAHDCPLQWKHLCELDLMPAPRVLAAVQQQMTQDFIYKGSLKLRSRHNMQFRLTSSAGLIDCHGQGKDEGLMVQWYSHISRKRGADSYSFVPCQVPEDDVWPEGVDPSLEDHFLLDYDMDPGTPHTPLSYMQMGEELEEAMEEEHVQTEAMFRDF